jgi:hypothetical protein
LHCVLLCLVLMVPLATMLQTRLVDNTQPPYRCDGDQTNRPAAAADMTPGNQLHSCTCIA